MTPYQYVHNLSATLNAQIAMSIVQAPPDSVRGAVTGYLTGTLNRIGPNELEGRNLRILFSDRVFANGSTDGFPQPFNVVRADFMNVGVLIDDMHQSIAVKLVLESWGNANQELSNFAVRDGVLTASGPSIGNTVPGALYAISLGVFTG
jgi:hypothetical protein